MLTRIDQHYIFDEFHYDMTNRIYFTYPAVSAKICTDTTIANTGALLFKCNYDSSKTFYCA